MSINSIRAVLVLCLLVASSPTEGQELAQQRAAAAAVLDTSGSGTRDHTYAGYVEAGGMPAFEGAAWTVNIERRLRPGTVLRVGAFYGSVDEEETLLLPVLVNLVATDPPHHLELGDLASRVGVVSPSLRETSLPGARSSPGRFGRLSGMSARRRHLRIDLSAGAPERGRPFHSAGSTRVHSARANILNRTRSSGTRLVQ